LPCTSKARVKEERLDFIAGWIVHLISGFTEYPYIIERLKNKRETRYV
jgi:hypothetical protein